MLFVHFQLGSNRYALDARTIVEVLPLLELKPVPQTPGGVAGAGTGTPPSGQRGYAGLILYRGQPVPAVDLCALTLDRPAYEHLNTRILLVRHTRPAANSGVAAPELGAHPSATRIYADRVEPSAPCESKAGEHAAGGSQLIGLIVERVAGTLQREAKDYVNIGVEKAAAPFLGPVVMDAQGIIQILDAQKLLDAGAPQHQLNDAAEAEESRPVSPPPPSPQADRERVEDRRGERAK